MFLSVHSIVALTSIKYISNPLLLFIVNFILHYILDAIPHGDGSSITKGFKNKDINIALMAIFDFGFVLVISNMVYKIYDFNIYYIIIALSGAILPDILWGIYRVSKIKFFKQFDDLNHKCHRLIGYKPKYIFEYSFQFIPIIICYFLLK
jgi:hypothetical protein